MRIKRECQKRTRTKYNCITGTEGSNQSKAK